jgi:hypothetical protein
MTIPSCPITSGTPAAHRKSKAELKQRVRCDLHHPHNLKVAGSNSAPAAQMQSYQSLTQNPVRLSPAGLLLVSDFEASQKREPALPHCDQFAESASARRRTVCPPRPVDRVCSCACAKFASPTRASAHAHVNERQENGLVTKMVAYTRPRAGIERHATTRDARRTRRRANREPVQGNSRHKSAHEPGGPRPLDATLMFLVTMGLLMGAGMVWWGLR